MRRSAAQVAGDVAIWACIGAAMGGLSFFVMCLILEHHMSGFTVVGGPPWAEMIDYWWQWALVGMGVGGLWGWKRG
jgi:hypothetical protein